MEMVGREDNLCIMKKNYPNLEIPQKITVTYNVMLEH